MMEGKQKAGELLRTEGEEVERKMCKRELCVAGVVYEL
jgi:hypothetical protein